MSSAGPPNEQSRAIGVGVRRRRQALGLTQQQLAEKLGCQQPAIAALESGGARPGLMTLERIAGALDAHLVVGLVGRDEALTKGVPFFMQPRSRCGYVFPSIDGRGRICNRIAGHAGQHRVLFEDETPPEVWD